MRFIVTKELGRLAKWLRILGYDTEYFERDDKKGLALRSLREERIIITRDTRFSKFAGYRTLHVHADDFRKQLKDVIESLGLPVEKERLFSRCVLCNVELEKVNKEGIKSLVPEYVYKTQDDFAGCKKCGRVYWHGTHWGNMQEIINLSR